MTAGQPAQVTVVATTHSQAHALSYGPFMQVLEEWPEIADDMKCHTQKLMLESDGDEVKHLHYVSTMVKSAGKTYGDEFNPRIQEFRME